MRVSRPAPVVLAFVLLAAAGLAPAQARQVVQKRGSGLEPPARGPAHARVVVERFCDYAQPQCAGVDASLAALAARHPDDLRVIYRTSRLHHIALSHTLAHAFWEAHAQGRFFAFLESYHAARPSERYALEVIATRAGLDLDAFQRALAESRHAARVDEDEAWAGRFGVDAVPALVWNGERRPLPAQDASEYEALFEVARVRADERLRAGVSLARLYPMLLREAIRARALEIVRGGVLVTSDGESPGTHRVNVPVGGAPVRGDRAAAVRIVVFGDYQCPHSRALAHTLGRLEEAYPGAIAVVWKHAPLDAHPDALLAARGAVCAQRQGQFWTLHERLFARSFRLDRDALVAHAADLGLDADRFAADLDTGACDARVKADLADARALGVHGRTPVLFVNGLQLTGAQPLAALRVVVDDELLPGALAELGR